MYRQNFFTLYWIPSGISLMKIRKRREPNIEPWGTPARISFQHEIYLTKNVLLNLRVDHLYHII